MDCHLYKPSADDNNNTQKIQEDDTKEHSLFGSKVCSVMSKMNLEYCDPGIVINMLKNPTIKVLQSFNVKLKTVDMEWVDDLLQLKGFEVLFDAIEALSESVTQLSDVMLLLECVNCVKNIMNSKVGLEYFLRHLDSGRKLVKALDSKHILVKKQVFELFAAITAYSPAGYQMTLDSLENYKIQEQRRYRFSIILDEIQKDKNQYDYWTTLLSLINCLIIANKGLYDRVNVRNEFIGLRLLEILDHMSKTNDEDLLVQCNVFYEEMHLDDEEMSNLRPDCIDINNHRQLFDVIMQQVMDTPKSESFLKILQCLMHANNNQNRDLVWEKLQKEVCKSVAKDLHKVTDINTVAKDKDNFWDESSALKPVRKIRERQVDCFNIVECNKENLNSTYDEEYSVCYKSEQEPLAKLITKESEPVNGIECTVSSTKGHMVVKSGSNISVDNTPVELKLLSKYNLPYAPCAENKPADVNIHVPKPKSIMKPLRWRKVSRDCAQRKSVVWSDVLEMKSPLPIKYEVVENLFSQTESDGNHGQANLLNLRKKTAIKSLLIEFRAPNEKILNYIRDGHEMKLGGRKNILSLSKLLPIEEELELLTIYEGDLKSLSNAESFLKQLIEIPEYSLRVDAMLLRCDFEEVYNSALDIFPKISASCEVIMNNTSLKEFLRLVLHAGNFINSGQSVGNAVGFKISSLSKLMEIKSNKTNFTLLHYLVEEAERANGELIKFVAELAPYLNQSCGVSYERTAMNSTKLQGNFQKVKKHLLNCSTEVKYQGHLFMKLAERDLVRLDQLQKSTCDKVNQLAEYYGEDIQTFNVDQCLETHRVLCINIRICQSDIASIPCQVGKCKKRTKDKHAKSGPKEDDGFIIEKMLKNIKGGLALKRFAAKSGPKEDDGFIIEKMLKNIKGGLALKQINR